MYSFKLGLVFILVVFLYRVTDSLKLSLTKRHALKNPKRLWPNATVPYILDPAYTSKQKSKLNEAMELISQVSCVRFVPRKFELGYMIVQKGNGCSARLGYKPNSRRVILGPNCMWSSRILHELMHILGFYHEQTRPDRDSFIKVYVQNIMSRYRSNFNKSNPKHTTTLDLPYDYHSILHYNSNGFAKNRTLKTMVPLQKVQGRLGMGKTLTPLDIAKLNKLYHCPSLKNETNDVSSMVSSQELPNHYSNLNSRTSQNALGIKIDLRESAPVKKCFKTYLGYVPWECFCSKRSNVICEGKHH